MRQCQVIWTFKISRAQASLSMLRDFFKHLKMISLLKHKSNYLKLSPIIVENRKFLNPPLTILEPNRQIIRSSHQVILYHLAV